MGVAAIVVMMSWRGLTGLFGTVGVRMTIHLDTLMFSDPVGHVLGLITRFRRRMKQHRRHEGDGDHQAEGADQ